jgi:hypothetical protein
MAGNTLRTSDSFKQAYARYSSYSGGSEDEFYEKVITQAKKDDQNGWTMWGIPRVYRSAAGLEDK